MPHALTELMLTAVTKPVHAPDQDIRTDVCVVGAGIAGLSAAIESARLGRDVVLVDSLPLIGGQMVHSLVGLFCGGFGDGYVWETFEADHVHYVPLRSMTPPGMHNLVAAGRCVDGDAAALSSVRVMGPCAAMGAGAAHALDLASGGSTTTSTRISCTSGWRRISTSPSAAAARRRRTGDPAAPEITRR